MKWLDGFITAPPARKFQEPRFGDIIRAGINEGRGLKPSQKSCGRISYLETQFVLFVRTGRGKSKCQLGPHAISLPPFYMQGFMSVFYSRLSATGKGREAPRLGFIIERFLCVPRKVPPAAQRRRF